MTFRCLTCVLVIFTALLFSEEMIFQCLTAVFSLFSATTGVAVYALQALNYGGHSTGGIRRWSIFKRDARRRTYSALLQY